jgi:hypothetical protein
MWGPKVIDFKLNGFEEFYFHLWISPSGYYSSHSSVNNTTDMNIQVTEENEGMAAFFFTLKSKVVVVPTLSSQLTIIHVLRLHCRNAKLTLKF